MTRMLLVGLSILLAACPAPPGDDDDSAPLGNDDDDVPGLPELDCPSEMTVYTGTAVFASDSDLATFLASHNEITGNLTVEGPEVTEAPHLGCLQAVGGELSITQTALPHIDLRSLKSVGLALNIPDNGEAQVLAAPALESVGLFTVIRSNAVLESIDMSGLQLAREFPPDAANSNPYAFQAERNPSLTELQLDRLERTQGDLDLNENDALIELHLPALTQVQGDLRIDNLSALQLFSVPALEEVNGEFRFDHNGVEHTMFKTQPEHPMTLELGALQRVGGRLYFDNNPSVTTLELGGLRDVGGEFFFRGSIVLETLPVSTIRLVGGDLLLSELYRLPLIDLHDLESVLGDMVLEFTRELTEFHADNLQTLDGGLRITQNEGLNDLSFPELTGLGGDLEVRYNTSLPDSQICSLYSQVAENLAGDFLATVSCQ